jgi:hypothetical protein
MAGGLLQLVASTDSPQDIYLTGNPEITFFKTVYRRHTNFAMESIQLNWQGSGSLNGRVSCIIPKLGDLLDKLYLNMTMEVTSSKIDGVVSCIYNPTHNVIDTVTINIGGNQIDRHTGSWMEVWSQLTEKNNIGAMGNITTNQGTKFQILTKSGSNVYYFDDSSEPNILNDSVCSTTTKFVAYVPLQFWFCKNTGLALPMIALRVHEVELVLQINTNCLLENSLDNSGVNLLSNILWGTYIFLDNDERQRFATSAHEYLIEQLSYREFSTTGQSLNLNYLNHPVKEIIWTGQVNSVNGFFTPLPGGYYDEFYENKYTPNNNITYNILLNNTSRFTPRPLEYFTQQQIYEFHTGTPVEMSGECINTGFSIGNSYQNIIAVYSFSLKPEDIQPTGSCNFTRIDDSELVINNYPDGSERIFNVYATNYNVMRICNGMAGILYSN